MPVKPFKIVKAPPPLKTPSALAKERNLSAKEHSAIERFASSVVIAEKSGKSTILYGFSQRAGSRKSDSKSHVIKGRAVARKK
jgi:hypothetical protein